MQSKAATVQQYLAQLPPDRRSALEAVRKVILRNLDKDYIERMSYGMIGYAVPHSVYPPGYHCDPKLPLPFAGLASQKNHMSVYLLPVYGSSGDEKAFRSAWAKTGKKLDMGKCCIRFKRIEDLALDVIGEAIRRMPVKKFIAYYEAVIRDSGKRGSAKAARPAAGQTARKPGAKKAATKRTRPAARKKAAARRG